MKLQDCFSVLRKKVFHRTPKTFERFRFHLMQKLKKELSNVPLDGWFLVLEEQEIWLWNSRGMKLDILELLDDVMKEVHILTPYQEQKIQDRILEFQRD